MRDSDSGDPPITSSSRALPAVIAIERSRSDLDNIARRSGGSLRRTALSSPASQTMPRKNSTPRCLWSARGGCDQEAGLMTRSSSRQAAGRHGSGAAHVCISSTSRPAQSGSCAHREASRSARASGAQVDLVVLIDKPAKEPSESLVAV